MSNALGIATIAAAAILVWVLFLYRKGRLKEDYALLWSGVSVAIILLSTWSQLLTVLNQAVGAARSSDLVLASFVALGIVVSIYYSVKISTLEKQNKRIAQEMALLRLSREMTQSD